MTPLLRLPPASADHPVWLHVGTLIDGTSTAPLRDAHVVYDNRAIRHVGTNDSTPPRDLLRPAQTQPDVSAPNATLLPGLIEAHAHLFLEGGELNLDKRAAYLKQAPGELLAAAKDRLGKLVHLGITAVRDAGDKDGVGLTLSRLYRTGQISDPPAVGTKAPRAHPIAHAGVRAISRGETGRSLLEEGGPCASTVGGVRPLMPYLDSPGAAIHHQGRYGSFMADAIENHASLRAVVAARVAAGADRIKLIPTGIINFKKGAVTAAPQMTTAEVAALVAAAKSCDRQTFAHASGDIGIDHAIDGGVDSIEHGFFLRDDQLARLRDRRIAWVPTFAPVQEQVDHADLMGWNETIVGNLRRILDRHAASLVKAHELGVLIIAGSDAGSLGVAHGLGFLYELELMERAGLPSLAVLNAATGTSAGRLGYKEKFGRIAAGFRPRFILTPSSPLESVANLRRSHYVVFDGNVFFADENLDPSGL